MHILTARGQRGGKITCVTVFSRAVKICMTTAFLPSLSGLKVAPLTEIRRLLNTSKILDRIEKI